MSRMQPADWSASGVIALTTDFGLDDPYVGAMKGVILSKLCDAKLVDVTHSVPAQNVRLGAFHLRAAYPYFPAGTVHVAVVDPGVGSERKLLVARDAGQCFLAPDNGLLPAALGEGARYHELDVPRFALPDASSTFHGRDVLAPAAAAIAGGIPPESAGVRAVPDPVRLETTRARRGADGSSVEATVLFTDHFGNVVLDLSPEELEAPLERWSVEHAGQEIAFARTYARVAPGKALFLVDSFGVIEIAVRDGSAAKDLGLATGDRVALRRRP